MNNLEKILVVGEGGREQAFADYLAQSPQVGEVLVAPGNPGTQDISKRLNKLLRNINIPGGTVAEVMDIVTTQNVDRVIVGSEHWLGLGLGDALVEKGIPATAPPENRAVLELSKAYAREMCQMWGVPQPLFYTFTDSEKAVKFVENEWQLDEGVVKVSGEAKGKGVKVCDNKIEMLQAIREAKKIFGAAADTLLIEERLYGPEVSYIVITDGINFYPFPPAMDYKRLKDGNFGPNTGGMGSIAPNPFVTPQVAKQLERSMVEPILKGMRELDKPYVGILYVSAMLTDHGPKLIEINCRGGDSETQAQLQLIPYDIFDLFKRSQEKSLASLGQPTKVVPKFSSVVVLAADGYPDKPTIGSIINGLNQINPNVLIYQAGTKKDGEHIVVNGGRVLNISATGASLLDVNNIIYNAIGSDGVNFTRMQYRTDIGK
jgi:phosphoribosylamine---glycine ligase